MAKKTIKKYWICENCGEDATLKPNSKFMVRNYLWEEYGVKDKFLCLNCFQKRVGRILKAPDFTISILNAENSVVRNLCLDFYKSFA